MRWGIIASGAEIWLGRDNTIVSRCCKMRHCMTKPTKWPVCQAKQISLGIRPVWSESSLSALGKLGSIATHKSQAKSLIRLRGCPGWSESSLGAQAQKALRVVDLSTLLYRLSSSNHGVVGFPVLIFPWWQKCKGLSQHLTYFLKWLPISRYMQWHVYTQIRRDTFKIVSVK